MLTVIIASLAFIGNAQAGNLRWRTAAQQNWVWLRMK